MEQARKRNVSISSIYYVHGLNCASYPAAVIIFVAVVVVLCRCARGRVCVQCNRQLALWCVRHTAFHSSLQLREIPTFPSLGDPPGSTIAWRPLHPQAQQEVHAASQSGQSTTLHNFPSGRHHGWVCLIWFQWKDNESLNCLFSCYFAYLTTSRERFLGSNSVCQVQINKSLTFNHHSHHHALLSGVVLSGCGC